MLSVFRINKNKEKREKGEEDKGGGRECTYNLDDGFLSAFEGFVVCQKEHSLSKRVDASQIGVVLSSGTASSI